MSYPGLTVRCLASTRINEQTWQKPREEEKDKQNSDPEENPETGNAQDISIRDEQNAEVDLFEAESNITSVHPSEPYQSTPPETRSGSDSNSESTSDSEGSSDDSNTSAANADLGSRILTTSCVQDAQLSPDGSCIFTSDYNRSFSVYPIANDILTEGNTRPLKPYSKLTSPNPIWAFTANPLFNVNDSNTTHVLLSRRDSYITLHNALWDTTQPSNSPTQPINIAHPLTSYKLINPLTEAVIAPLSLTYSHTGTHFFASHQNAISIYDVAHSPAATHTIRTIPSARSKLKGGGRGFKGSITALALSPSTSHHHDGLLAAGSRTRYIGLYDSISGAEVSHFALPGTLDGKKVRAQHLAHVVGDGVSSVKWSPCARYLYVAERMADCVLVYDVRMFALALGYCAGRRALTKQRLGFDVWNAGASEFDVEAVGHEIWAGGTDGCVRVWRDPWAKEGAVEADGVVRVGGGDAPVVSTMVHASGQVAVAACGRVDVGEGAEGRGVGRGGGVKPRYREWGSVDILGLS